ncbi:MAG: diacylglycerol kinase family protein [Pirellulaceae bacterium]
MSASQPPKENGKPWVPRRRGWVRKLGDAFFGIAQGARGQSSFAVHVIATIAVLVLAAYLPLSVERWCLLILCIGIVLTAELFNTSLEQLACGITRDDDPHIGRALNIASGAVLIAALAAAIVGTMIFVSELI